MKSILGPGDNLEITTNKEIKRGNINKGFKRDYLDKFERIQRLLMILIVVGLFGIVVTCIFMLYTINHNNINF